MSQNAEQATPQAPYQPEYAHYINGEWVGGESGELIDLINPATGEVLSRIHSGNSTDINRAVDAAAEAFKTFRYSTPKERQDILMEMANRLRNRIMDFALMESLNNGCALREGLFLHAQMAIDHFEMFAGAAYSLHGKTVDYPDAVGVVHREPLGVMAQIIPWNGPLGMLASKIAPAIATGNTVVLKPAETVCLSVMEFIRECSDIIPKGVINVVNGYGANVGQALVEHPKVAKVAFTGSVATARRIIGYSAKNIIPATLELGGKSANIVCADANLELAVEGAAMCCTANKGEICVNGSRLFLHESIHDEFLARLDAQLKEIRQGNPLDLNTVMGAQASSAQFEKIKSYIEIGQQEGATVFRGGKHPGTEETKDGFFIEPTVLSNVTNDMRVAQEEIFGPVVCAIKWKDVDDVLAMANDSVFGLASGVWTNDLTTAHYMARNIEAGSVWINRYFNMKNGLPFGGYKQSGYGREFSFDVMDHYTQLKSVVVNLDQNPLNAFAEIPM